MVTTISRTLIVALLASTLSVTGCKTRTDDGETSETEQEERSPEEGVVDKLQGSWTINLEPTLATATDLAEREKLVAREMLSNLRLTIDGMSGEVSTRILGTEQAQDWELAISDVDGDTFQLCITHDGASEPQCNDARWDEEGFRVETPDGLVTYYVPAEEQDAAQQTGEDQPEGDTTTTRGDGGPASNSGSAEQGEEEAAE